MNHRRIRTQSLALLLIVSFLIPSGLAIPTKKAEAAMNCIAPIAGAIGSALSLIATKEVIGVSTAPGDSGAAAVTAGGQYGQFFNDCILKPLAIKMARIMVRNISNSIVNWINGGFQGKPGFVTDFKGLVSQTADQAIGDYIYGTDLKFLCQPFSVKIRLTLATKYQRKFQEEIRCTLSSITGNVNNFVNNNGGRGWNNWFEITTQPQNNQYGAYLMAESELASRIQDQLDQVTKTLDRSNGFLDYKICDEKAPDRETGAQASLRVSAAMEAKARGEFVSAKDLDATPRCKTGGRVVTPGSLVNDQAKTVLGNWADQLNLATEIDQIVGALISHFADKMITGAQGFLGLSSAGGYARNNLSVNQALAAGDNLTFPENAGLEQLNLEAGSTISFTDDLDKILASQTVETGVNILEGRSIVPTGPSGVAKSNIAAMTDGEVGSIGTVGSVGSGSQSLWVKLDLATSTEVSEVHIWHPNAFSPADSIGTFNLVFSNQENGRTWVSSDYTLTEGAPNPTVVRVDRAGRYITLERKGACSSDCQPLRIAEIEVIGRASNNSGVTSDTSGEAPVATSVIFGPTEGEVAYGTSSRMDILVPINTNKNIVIKSLEAYLYSANREIPFNAVLSNGGITLSHGGFKKTIYPANSAGTKFVNLQLDPTRESSISITGWTNDAVAPGSYRFELTMKDDTGEILDSRTVNFVVQ